MPTALITGASTGIGKELARLMARQGYMLGLIARRAPLLEELRLQILGENPQAQVWTAVADVNDDVQIRTAILGLAEKFGGLDIFIANAGIGVQTPAWKNNWQEIRPILQTNILGAIASLEAAKEIMLKQKSGHLVGISSVAAFRGLPATSAYCTSKAALMTYLEAIRADLKGNGITVTSIHPGFIATPMTEKNGFMPFLLSAEVGAQKILRAIQKKKSRFIFPWPMKILVGMMRLLPDGLYDWIVSRQYKGVFR